MRPADNSFKGALPCVCVCAKLCVIYKTQKRRLKAELESGPTEKIKSPYIMIVVHIGL